MIRLLACVPILVATLASGAIRSEAIEYKHGDTTLRGHLVYDDAAEGKRAGVLVVPEWWGLNDYAKSRAEQLARLGYVAFAVDMYGEGKVAADPAGAKALAGPLYADAARMRGRAAAGLAVLAGRPEVDASRIAAIGYCFGGTVALELARSGAELAAVVSFHGGLKAIGSVAEEGLKPRILVLHGAEDPMVPAAEVQAFEAEMKAAKADYELVSYGGAVHAFTNPGVDKVGLPGARYDAKADARSWTQMRTLFSETIDGEG